MKCNLKRLLNWLVPIVCLLAGLVPSAQSANLVQEFYLPMPEQQIYTANNSIIAGTGSTIASTFSIVVTGNGTVIYYDQWEDGYETDLANPTQPTTQIWGDGNDAHGIPPGFAHNPLGLPAGTVITLTNNVPLPRNPSTILWDARDRIAANKALVITRAAWPIPTGPVFAGAAGVLSTIDYGTNYISPVGQNLPNNLFKYVGMFIMAAQDNTAVTIDPTGTGIGTTNIILNQGESYLVNGGILKGGRVTATKPVQADLIIGHVGASYASDWFTLYPVNAWDNSYYTPVGSAASGSQPAYVYIYNPGNNAITINYSTRVGSGSFSVPGTNGVYQFQMPVGSGASFVSAGGQNFYALCTVAANNSSDTAYNWGFTLVPKAALTTEATVGWGPGSADGTVNGSPVWVTALTNTKLYVDYKGDHAGPLAYTNGGIIQNYDTNFTVTALQSQKIFDPSKNQTGMRIYTVDGTLITAAWGEDPDTAQPGNPYIDAGTTVIPFPVPVVKKSAVIVTDAPPTGLSIGDYIQYTVEVDNKGLLPLGNTVVIDAPSTNLTYITNSTTYNGASISDSATGTPFPLDAPGYTIPVILSQGISTFTYLVQVNASGAVSNNVTIGGTTISAQTFIPPASTNATTVSLNFTDTNGVPLNVYSVGANVYITMTNAVGNTSSNSVQTISVTVVDTNSLDLETITLTETGPNTGIFRNIAGLPTSAISGLAQQDGVLNVAPGDTLSVSYTDPVYFDSASSTASILVPTPNKQLYLSVNGSTNGTQLMNRISPVAYGHGPVHTSIDIGQGGGVTAVASTIGIDGSFSTNTTISPVTFNYTTGSGSNRLMLVTVGVQHDSGAAPSISNIAYNGTNLNLVASALKGFANPKYGVYVYALTNPLAGSGSLQVTWSGGGSSSCIIGVNTFTNVNQATPFNDTNTAAPGTSITVNSATNQLVYGTIYGTSTESLAAGQNATVQWTTNYTGTYFGMGCTTVGSNSAATTMTWTASAYAIGVSINPATTFVASGGGGPSTNVTAFTQTPVFASSFTMPAGGVVAITNFITITNGSLSSGSAVTATLQTNGVNFLTLVNPVYNAAGGVTNLVWTGILTTNITIPAGSSITCVVSNNVANTAFHINYDSTNAPSVIILPASTVIQVNAFGIYDAPYPGGNLVTAPVAGFTLYVRASVSDPFGSYDITSLGLAVTGPDSSSSFTNVLTDANVVTNDNLSKIYEYQWATGPTTGGYNIAVTAHEGTEGVTATAAASITTTFLDLGTPSTTLFTSGNNGSPTNTYLAGSPVCIQVSDLNRNTNTATIDSVMVTVASSTGDSEIVTLFETGTNTGVFANCINASTNVVGAPNDGTLYAPVGSILTASYTDPTDPSDSTSATATVQPAPGIPGVSISKTIVSPAGGQVGINQPVTYNLQVVNTGSTVLTNVAVTDNFPSAKLTYSTANPVPDIIGSGALTWNTLGSFAPGQSTNITITFNTTSVTGTLTNSATVNGGTLTNTSAVTLLVNKAALNVVKILLSPTNTPVAVGSNVVFRITVQNVGNTTVNYLPLEDTFSGAYYQFVSSTITNNGSGAGAIIWTNLAYPIALATNAIITNDVTMKVVGQGSPANNTATVDFATDVFDNPVPVSSSTIGVNTATASINGHVYNDINQSGVYTNGDSGLSGVTLQLFTDPDGDGDPSDGTLVQITTSDVNGYYELLNLSLGHYVIVETTLPGYVSSAPANNRLALNLTTLTASTNNNFFQYVPTPSVYSTISGTVWYDLNGDGANNVGETNIANVEIDLVSDVNSNGLADSGEPVVASVTTDANGNYSFAGVTPGSYVIREVDTYGYYSTGDSQPPNDNQISFASTNGIVSTNNNFFDRLSPVAVNDSGLVLYFVPATLFPLTNDISPNGDALTITNAASTNGIVVINPGSTNLTFTPTNLGTAVIAYTIADAHGGTSTAVITENVTALADLAVGKTASVSVLATSNLVYTIAVTNFGPTPADLVVVTDALPVAATFVSASAGGVNNSGVVNWNLGVLTNGQVSTVTVTVAAPASGTLTNAASVSSPTSDPNPTNNTSLPVFTTVSPVANLAIGKSGSAFVAAASDLTYTISVTNFGPSSASSVVVTDALPAGATFVSATGGGVNNSNVVDWDFGTLTNNQVTNVTVTVTAPTGGSLTNIAIVSSPTTGTNILNNVTPPVVTTVTSVADLAVGKSGPAGNFAGGNFSYTISVTNFGPSTATALSVTDSLPAGLVFVSSLPVTTTNAGNQVIWSLGDLAAGAVTNLTLNVAATLRGTVTNFASVGSSTLDTTGTNNISAPAITAVTNRPPIAVNDTASTAKNVPVTVPVLINDSDPDGDVLTIIGVNPTNGTANIVGASIVFTPATNFVGTATAGYTITDGNGGTNSALITISVTNVIIPNSPPVANDDSYTTAQSLPLIVPAAGVLTNDTDADSNSLTAVLVSNPTHGTLVLGADGGFTYTPTNNFTGTDTFTYRANDGVTNSGVATVTISVSPAADVAIFKTGPASGVAGSNLVYAITVTNLGPSAATNVLVKDLLPNGFTFVSATPAPATVVSNLVSWPGFSLASKARTNFTVTVVSTEGGMFTNVAFSTSGTFDLNPANNDGTATNAQARTVVTPRADVAVFKVGGTNVVAGGSVAYTITATNFGPSTASNVVVSDRLPGNTTFQSASAGYSLSNGVVTWPSMTLGNGATTNFTVVLIAPSSGSFTNIAFSTSDTLDPNPTNNNGSASGSKARTAVVPAADLIVFLSGPTNVSVGDNFTYTIIVTNGGPSAAASVVTKDKLPASLAFISATSGGVFSNGVVTWPAIASLANGATTNFIVTVSASGMGQFTNVASAASGTFDPNPANNDGTALASQVQTIVASAQFGLLAGTPVFNPQTGLFEDQVIVTNIGATTVAGVRLYVGGLRSGVTLYNATGTTNGVPYVQYNSPVDPSNTVTFALEFYDTNRLSFTYTLTAVAILPPDEPSAGTNAVAITREFMDTRIEGDTRFVIEFTTVPGKIYTVIYSDDLVTWKVATPSVTANANVTQWYDDGPPKTDSKPESVGGRYYRVIQN